MILPSKIESQIKIKRFKNIGIYLITSSIMLHEFIGWLIRNKI